MERTQFNLKELEIKEMHVCGAAQVSWQKNKALGKDTLQGKERIIKEPLYERPISCKENFKLLLEGKKPYWVPRDGWTCTDVNHFRPRIHPDNVATRIICDGEPFYEYGEELCEKGWFDLNWMYVPIAGGATVEAGEAKVPSMVEWEKYITMPNLDDLDWEHCFNANREYMSTNQMNQLGILSGFWERLMSLMGVADAAMALIDEDEQEGVHRFFDQYADLLIEYIDRMSQKLRIDCVLIHDDWGHQNGPFFSMDTAMEMLVPYLKRVTDAVHTKGMLFELHSCGKNEVLVPAFIEAGVDIWGPQAINDIDGLAKQYKDKPIIFGAVDPAIKEDATEEEIKKLAEKWYEKYKDYRVCTWFLVPNKIFMDHLYQISRQE